MSNTVRHLASCPHGLRKAIPLALLLASSAALAQPSSGLEEVVVTAQKRVQSLQDTPIAITAFGADELEQRSIRNIGDLAAMAPNVKISPMPSNTAKATIAIRGAVTSNPAITWEPTVGIYLDGIFVGKYSGNVFNIMDLERIEVLRGPQGTLYGKNTMGGAVNVITRKPGDEFGGMLRAGIGNYGFWELYGSVDPGALELGDAGTLKSKLTLSKQSRDGFYKNRARNTEPLSDPFGAPYQHPANPVSSRDFNELDTKVGRLDLLWEATDAFEMRYILDKVDNDNTPAKPQLTHFDPNDMTFGFPLPAELADYVISKNKNVRHSPADFDIYERFTSTSQSLFADYQLGTLPILGDVTLKYLGNHRKLDYKLNLDLDGTPFEIFHSGQQREEYRQRSHELQLTGSAARTEYVLGLYYIKEDADVLDPLMPINQFYGPFVLDHKYGFDGKQYAAFGQVEYRPAAAVLEDRLSLTAGVRWTREKKSGYQHKMEYSPEDFDATGKGSWNNTSITLIAAYDLTDGVNVYAKYAEGFKAGGFNGESDNEADFRDGYDPEKVKSFELGLKSRWLDQRLQLNAATFYNKETDLQLLVFSGGQAASSKVVNAGKAVKSGAELEVVFQPISDLQLVANYGYLDARYKEFMEYVEDAGAIIDNKRNKDTPYAPQYIYNLGAEYTLARGDWGTAQVRIDYSYQDEYVIYSDKSSNETLRIKGFGVLNGRLSVVDIPVGSSQLQLALWGKNLLDKDYRVGGIPFGPYTVSYFGDPRTFGVETLLTF